MHKTMLAIIFCGTFALPATADTISGGKIISVDSGGKSFHYSWRKKHWTFKTTDTTVVRVGNKTGSLSDIKAGQAAKVEFQRQGDERIAVIIIGLDFNDPAEKRPAFQLPHLGPMAPAASCLACRWAAATKQAVRRSDKA